MEGVNKKKGTSSHDYGVDGAEASWQAPEGDRGWKFEVFLSFRGADTRKGFIGHLYEALVQRGISTFIDNEDLEKGERVEELFRYIERSKMFVPIISKGYADSKWCLREITKIVECRRLIIPVFFGIQPSDIRNQEGPFKSAFERHENNEELKKEVSDWKNALGVVGQISGFNLEDANCHEADLIKCILERIMKEVKSRLLDVGDYPTGLDSRVDEVIKRLDAEIGMVGICGMGGIGKTTLAKAVYNRLCSSFEACSFLANVREASKQFNGIVGLQKQLLRNVLGSKVQVDNRDEGITLIKQRIGGMEVLIVVDDADHEDQLNALIGSRSGWFGGKSRIIVTSRDGSIFNARQVSIYRVAELDSDQSLQLFSQHAFGQSEPPSDWRGELSEKVVSIAGGIPLCLKVFGPLFSNLQSSKEWESMLEKLEKDQHKEVHKRLKISYDSLDEKTKRIFLDIACFLLSNWDDWEEYDDDDFGDWESLEEKKEYAMQMWEGSELHPTVAIAELQRKYLISIHHAFGTFEMHDQIRDMGRNIVQQEKPVPSRFWENNETLKVLQRKQGTENIEGIIFQRLDQQYMTPLNTMSLRNMVKLRILDANFTKMKGSYRHLPNSLKFLRWWQCPLKSLAVDVPIDNIVVLDLTESKIKRFLGPSVTNCSHFGCFPPQEANHSGKFSQLKVLILKDCKNLRSTPDFRLIPNASKLIFEGCTNLSQVHESIGDLQSLVCLNLNDCSFLKKIPDSICRLNFLEILNLKYCGKISTLPEKLGDLLSLRELLLHECSQLMDVPGLAKLRCLEHLDLGFCCALKDMEYMMKEAKLEQYKHMSLPGRLSTCSRSESTGGVWTSSATVSFHLPNVPHLGHASIFVGSSPGTVTEVKAVRHDDSFILFERAEGERQRTESVINMRQYGVFIAPKEEDEKEKAGMIRDGKRYRRVDVTFERESEGESNFSDKFFNIDLWSSHRPGGEYVDLWGSHRPGGEYIDLWGSP